MSDLKRPKIVGYRAPVTSAPYCVECVQKHQPFCRGANYGGSNYPSASIYDTHENCIQCGKSLRGQ